MAEIGKVELDTDEYLKISEAMLELARQRDEAQRYTRIMCEILADMPVALDELDERLDNLPEWVFERAE